MTWGRIKLKYKLYLIIENIEVFPPIVIAEYIYMIESVKILSLHLYL